MALADNLTHYYKLETNANDSVGTSHGTSTSVTYSTANGKIGDGSGYNGSSSYVSVPSFTMGTSWTVSCWVKQTAGDTGVVIGRDIASPRGMYIYADSSGFALAAFNTSGTYYDTGIYAITHQGSWVHVVAIYEAGVNARIIVNNNTPRTIAVTGNSADANAITFGRRDYSGSELYFTGAIDEIGFWNRALTPAEITQLYNSGAGLTYPFTGGASSAKMFNFFYA